MTGIGIAIVMGLEFFFLKNKSKWGKIFGLKTLIYGTDYKTTYRLNTSRKITNRIMTKEEFFKSNYFKILLPVIVAALIIALWRNGYEFGQWLHRILN